MSAQTKSVMQKVDEVVRGSFLEGCHNFRELISYVRYVRSSIKRNPVATPSE